MGAFNLLVMIVGFCILFIIYFLPTIIAFRRKKENRGAILLLNLFLGWSLIGWVISLVWAVKKDAVDIKQPASAVVNT